jgi:arabinofuranosyltransferase
MEQPQAVSAVRPKWLAIGAVVVLLGLALRVSWVTEDAYITLRTVDNWIHGYGLRWNVNERVQSYTHPLWMLLLSAGYFVTREAFVTTIALGMLTTTAAVLTLVHFARTAGHAVAAVVLLTLSRGFLDFATSGLENPLSHLLLITFVGLYATRETPLWKLALTAALLACNRIDAILVVAPASWLELRSSGAKQTARALALGFSPLIAWELFSTFYYGFPFPNTAYAKLNTGLPRLQVIAQGLTYWVNTLSWDVVLHLGALAGVAVACLQRRRRDMLLALGVVLYTLYVINIGGDFMQGRFFTIPFFTGVCLIAISELPLEEPLRALTVGLPLGLLLVHPLAKEPLQHSYVVSGVADERSVYRDDMSLVMSARTRSLPSHGWAREGLGLRARGEKLHVHQNVGVMGFFAGPSVHIVDALALTDPLLARLPMRHQDDWRVGHYLRKIPSGYLELAPAGLGAPCTMRDKRLCEYYGHLREVISGPLFSFSRIKSVVAINLGSYDSLIDREKYRIPAQRHASFEEASEPVKELAAWDATGTLVVAKEGMRLDVPEGTRARSLELCFDGNDGYVLEFRKGGKVLGSVDSAALEAGLMRTRRIEVPEAAHAEGFDHIVVRPYGGDGMYSLGYLRLYD